MAARHHGVGDLGMPGSASGLVNVRFVAVEAEPVQAVQDRRREGGGGAGAVGVLHPQQELAAMVAREQIVEQRRPGPPDMEQPGW